MTYKENITAILECHFTGFKQEIIDNAVNCILALSENKGDLISRQAVLELTEHLEADFANSFDPHTLAEIYRRVKELPSVENKGEWIIDKEQLGYWISTCSVCGHIFHGNEVLIYKPKFCSNCGARMKGGG